MEFLGMKRKVNNFVNEEDDPIKKMEAKRAERKLEQENNMKKYIDAKGALKEEIDENEGTDIMETMLKERREWVLEKRQNNLGKVPDDIKPFYERFNVETPLSPEEQAAKDAEDEEGGGKGKKKDKKAPKKKGKKGAKEDGEEAPVKIGPSEVVQKFDEQFLDFTNDWVALDETDNYKQEHDVNLAKKEVQPLLEEEYKQQVDDMIKMELENMKLLSNAKAKKKKKKKAKKKKKKKKKGLKLPGYKMIKDLVDEPK